jgi:serine/threonine-protein kinase
MAPEQVTGRRVSPATDVYALGAVAYHCLSGRPPFTGDTPSEVALRHLSDEPAPLPPDVPAAMRMLVARALRKDPAQRYPSAAAFARALREVVAHPDASRSTVADRSLLRDPHRQPRWAAGRVTAAATLLVGGAVALLLGSAPPASTSPVDRPITSVPSAGAAVSSDAAAAPIVATSHTAPVASIGTTPTPPLVVAAPAGQIPASVALTDTTTSSPQPLSPPSATTGPSSQPVPPPPSTTASPSPELNPTPSEVSPSPVPSGAPRSS